ncbi:DUF6194 family protein [Allokutzneria sp. A3M-2-11 16]|uniref:DUF6194 family protein n=1 Tax=Allokutzneria sp. A3M-2-11 16 TaxID=2962043 RepID=UPI0020B747D9|nr:DUF6194 family protein [Allokutzneria sp. A3M-2-11 16]MCP3805116.1 DUF6194 family protein [Allokutzneria sp. A3M-2-11 16]
MSMEQILDTVRGFDGVLELAPAEGSEFPEIAWGDHFFYYAPDGQVPQRTQPYATIVTKNYPDDALSDLDPPGRWRLNIHVGRAAFMRLTGEDPKRVASRPDFSAADVVLRHPVYSTQGWIAIVNPGDHTTPLAVELLREAHENARRRAD